MNAVKIYLALACYKRCRHRHLGRWQSAKESQITIGNLLHQGVANSSSRQMMALVPLEEALGPITHRCSPNLLQFPRSPQFYVSTVSLQAPPNKVSDRKREQLLNWTMKSILQKRRRSALKSSTLMSSNWTSTARPPAMSYLRRKPLLRKWGPQTTLRTP